MIDAPPHSTWAHPHHRYPSLPTTVIEIERDPVTGSALGVKEAPIASQQRSALSWGTLLAINRHNPREVFRPSPAIQLPFASPALSAAREALAQEWGRDTVIVGSGGSIPIIGELKRELGIDSLMIGFALENDRIHSPNEKYNVSSFQGGARSWVRVLEALAK